MDGDRLQRSICDGIAGIVDHIGTAVFADFDGCYDIIQECFRGNEIDDAYDRRTLDPSFINRGGNHDGKFARYLTDQRFGYVDIALHCLLYVLTVRIVVAVKDTDAVRTDNVSALKSMHTDPFIYDRALFFQRNIRIKQLRYTAGIHGDVLVCG